MAAPAKTATRAARREGWKVSGVPPPAADFLILVEMVRAAGACALLPDLVLGYGVPGVAVRTLAEGTIDREVFLLTRAARTPAVEVVAAALHEAAP